MSELSVEGDSPAGGTSHRPGHRTVGSRNPEWHRESAGTSPTSDLHSLPKVSSGHGFLAECRSERGRSNIRILGRVPARIFSAPVLTHLPRSDNCVWTGAHSLRERQRTGQERRRRRPTLYGGPPPPPPDHLSPCANTIRDIMYTWYPPRGLGCPPDGR